TNIYATTPYKIGCFIFSESLKRNLALALVGLGLTTTGALLYWPLTFAALPLLFYLEADYTFRDGYRFIFIEKRVGAVLIDSINFYGSIITGNYFAASVGKTFYYSNRKVLWHTEDHSTKSLINVFGEQPRSIWILVDGVEVEMAFEELKGGDIVVVHAGETVPVDGAIQSGIATIDQRTLTGESQPIEKEEGEQVFASTIVLSGKICVRVEKTGKETVAAQIGHILNDTLDFKKTIQFRGEAVIDKWVWPSLALTGLTLPLMGLTSAVAVSFANFGYHMRISAPISVLNYLRITSRNGILVKDGRSLELLAQVDTIVFDKTGTLTEDVPHVGEIYTCLGVDEQKVLTYAAAAEYKQTHPIAQAILSCAMSRKLDVPPINDATVAVGYGLKVEIEGQEVLVGSARFMEMSSIDIPASISNRESSCHENGYSLVYVAISGQLAGAIELMPTIRPEAKEIISSLRQRKLEIFIISGDHETPTRKLAQELGIVHYFAQVLPEDKADLIARLQRSGKTVCFVGDGINDSIALKSANVSVSLRGASTIAIDTASIILMDGTLKQLEQLFVLADELESTLRTGYLGTIIPGVICVGGVWFVHLGILGAMMLYYSGLLFGVSNASYPLLKHKIESTKVVPRNTID
ncbi:MAG TPA: heavy metal translocating P-type ATPase, partial [Thiotrichaceae bacterium]|nr:heavy metal translocating P-type ATPase [Thiotrichaceae bacterium]